MCVCVCVCVCVCTCVRMCACMHVCVHGIVASVLSTNFLVAMGDALDGPLKTDFGNILSSVEAAQRNGCW